MNSYGITKKYLPQNVVAPLWSECCTYFWYSIILRAGWVANLPHVVLLAEDHAAFGETRRANVCQHGRTTRTLEATVVPIAVQRVQEESFHDFAAAPRAYFHCVVVIVIVVVVDGGIVVGMVRTIRWGARAGEGGVLVVVVRVLLVGAVGVACNNIFTYSTVKIQKDSFLSSQHLLLYETWRWK